MMRNLTAILWLLIFPVLAHSQPAGVDLKMELNRKYYMSHRENTIYLKASIVSESTRGEESPDPLNIALVVDRSGSMAGEPIEHLRKALV